MKSFFLLVFLYVGLFGNDDLNQLYEKNKNKILQPYFNNSQEKQFKEIKKDNDTKNIHYELKPIELIEKTSKEDCVEVGSIIFDKSDILSTELFDKLKQPYLNNCNGIKQLTNLTNEISNEYIKLGYVTSRAYLKMQDLSDGTVEISILEGKISKIIGENLYTKNIFDSNATSILNMKDLEASIRQYSKLKSKKALMSIKPASEEGYSDVIVAGEDIGNPFYGSFNINNTGTKTTGKYPINLSLNYENLFGINDIINYSLGATDRASRNINKTLGNTISYSFPYLKHYFTIGYSDFHYKQQILSEFGDMLLSEGKTKTFSFSYEYDLYNSKQHSYQLFGNLNKKSTKNYLNETLLEIQNSTISTAEIGVKDTYSGDSGNYYLFLKIQKSLDIFGTKVPTDKQIDFTKYILDINYATSLNLDNTLRLSSIMHSEYVNQAIYGTEQISVGGTYSVRGFSDASLVGHFGGYLRNDISYNITFSNGIYLSPFIGLDYGYVQKTQEIAGGNIVGSSIGINFAYRTQTLKVYYDKPIEHTDETKGKTNNIVGVEYVYTF